MVKKAVVAAAGSGTRLLTFTKEIPKEMLPIYSINDEDSLHLKPMIQLIFEQVYDFGIRNFCFVVGRGKRSIQDHFTPDYNFLKETLNKNSLVSKYYFLELKHFYQKLKTSSLFWVNQSPPLGFGHAVLQAGSYVGDDDFFLFAGDTLVISSKNCHLARLERLYKRENADAAFLILPVDDPQNYGILYSKDSFRDEVIRINRVVEKPDGSKSNLAIMPIYIFRNTIFDYLKLVKPGKNNEIQLTDAIQMAISDDKIVVGTRIKKTELLLDIGTPETYYKAIIDSHSRGKRIK
jgi:UTP--glucose-1-phosphate uridylyltransferase